jgi:hypothetical protein
MLIIYENVIKKLHRMINFFMSLYLIIHILCDNKALTMI